MNTAHFDFTGATAIVTGGTSGIGLQTATALREAGAHVTVTGTGPSAADYDVDLSGMTYRQLRMTETSAVTDFAASHQQLDILVNNAGATFPGGLDESTPEGFSESVAVNLLGTYRLTVGLYPALRASRANGGASVVMLASMSALRAVPLVPGYGAAKAGIISITQDLAVKWIADKIRVNAIAPGLILTRMTEPMTAFPELMQQQLARVPSGRMGTPSEIAAAILFLCTHHSAYTTGTSLTVDGGYTAQ